ncbi:hypothetical protein [Psychrobacter sp. 16-MNA-CIBAN-0192]|uniref:hypothetical protein n=1 Tax=Psychrobacter sp. 16-MNA-CIBAN-0192 TaxID=3140448 RepID=UPI0033286157
MKLVESFGKALFKPLFPYLNTPPQDELRNNKYRFLYDYSNQLYKEEVQRFKDLEDKSFKLLTALSIISLVYIPVLSWVLTVTEQWCILSLLTIPFIMIDVACFSRAWISLNNTFKIIYIPKLPLNDNLIELFKDDNEHINSIYYNLYQGYSEATIKYKLVNDEKANCIEDGHKYLQKGFKYFIVILSFAVIGMILESL